jgi:hypothetical protein
MLQTVFSVADAQALQGKQLHATRDYSDEFQRVLIPSDAVCRVIGIDAWEEYDACIAVQHDGNLEVGEYPKIVMLNETAYHEHFALIADEP